MRVFQNLKSAKSTLLLSDHLISSTVVFNDKNNMPVWNGIIRAKSRVQSQPSYCMTIQYPVVLYDKNNMQACDDTLCWMQK